MTILDLSTWGIRENLQCWSLHRSDLDTEICYPLFFQNTTASCLQYPNQESWYCILLLQVVKETIDPGASVEFKPNTADDPHMRKPDISKAKSLLNWEPKVSLKQGLPRMVSDFQKRIMDENWGAQATSLSILYHTDRALFGALKPLTELRWRTNCQKFLPPGRVIFLWQDICSLVTVSSIHKVRHRITW